MQEKEKFQIAVKLGDEEITRGEITPYSQQLMISIEKRAIKKAKAGEKVTNQDVLPE